MFDFIRKYAELTIEDVELIKRTNQLKHFKKDDLISNFSLAYFVLSGSVCAYYKSSDRPIITDFFLEGDPVILPNQMETEDNYFLKCLEPTTFAVSSPIEGERLVREFPRFESICRRFAEEKLNY